MRGHTHHPDEQATLHARKLRRNTTFPERILWGKLRAGWLVGLRFRRQHPIGPFVADFYCDEMKLVIELDGDSHSGRAMADHGRTDYLLGCGLRVVRFGNDDILRDLDAVLMAILTACGIDANVTAAERRPQRPSP